MTALEFVLIVISAVLLLRTGSFLYRRMRLLISIIRLNRLDGVRAQITSPLAFLLPAVLRRPAAIISIGERRRYSVRLFNGKGALYAAHIASPEYAAVFMKSAGSSRVRLFGKRAQDIAAEGNGVYRPVTVYMPPRSIASGDIPVTVLSPAPHELTYVTPERTSVSVAFTGDSVNGERIFTRSTLCTFIDRDSREFFD